MDTEDLGEYGIAPRQVQTTAAFDGGQHVQKTQKHRLAWEHSGSVSSVLSAETDKLIDIVKPVSDTSAVKVLRKMGWRQGKGVGTLTLAERSTRVKQLNVPSTSAEAAAKFQFAPDDFDLLTFEEKHDTRGIGYHGLAHTHVLNEQFGHKSTAVKATKQQKRGIRGQAFGVGAFEDDDDDIYTSEDTSKYDFTMGGCDPNKNALEGGSDAVQFVISEKAQMPKKLFEPPKLPRDYDPKKGIHANSRVGSAAKTRDRESDRYGDGHRSRVSIPDRRRLLEGENADKQGAQSVLTYLKDADRKRLEAIREQTKQRQQRHESKEGDSRHRHESDRHRREEPVKSTTSRKSVDVDQKIDMHVYDKQPDKQKRFVDYVSYLSRGLTCPQAVGMTDWEWDKERSEFEQHLPQHMKLKLLEAKALRHEQKPLAGESIAANFLHLIGRKFTSANRQDQDDNVDEKAPDDDRTHAVKMEMFGSLTRTKLEWHPDKMLCKRFNVPEPSTFVGCPSLEAARSLKDKKRDEDSNLFMGVGLPNTEQDMQNRHALSQQAASSSQQSVKDEPNVKSENLKAQDFPAAIFSPASAPSTSKKTTELEVQLSAVDLAERPSMDLFRTIFGDANTAEKDASDSELSDEDNSAEQLRQTALSTRTHRAVTAITGVAQPLSYKPMTLQPVDDYDEGHVHMSGDSGAGDAMRHVLNQESSFGPALPPPGPESSGSVHADVKLEYSRRNNKSDDDGIEIIKEKSVKPRSGGRKQHHSRDTHRETQPIASVSKVKSEKKKKKKHKSKDKHRDKKSKKKRSKSSHKSSDTEELSSD